jgi:hypothetical protein
MTQPIPASIDAPVRDFAAALDQPHPSCASAFHGHFSSTIFIPRLPRPSRKRSEFFACSMPRFARSNSKSLPTARSRAPRPMPYHEPFIARSPQLYQPATLARIQSGANISASDALRARRDLQASRHAIRKVFAEVDVLLTPTVPVPPPVIADLLRASGRPASARADHAAQYAPV